MEINFRGKNNNFLLPIEAIFNFSAYLYVFVSIYKKYWLLIPKATCYFLFRRLFDNTK